VRYPAITLGVKSIQIPLFFSTRRCVGRLYIVSCNRASQNPRPTVDLVWRELGPRLFPPKIPVLQYGQSSTFSLVCGSTRQTPLEQVPVAKKHLLHSLRTYRVLKFYGVESRNTDRLMRVCGRLVHSYSFLHTNNQKEASCFTGRENRSLDPGHASA
jgi:hypothetical protein